jgi:signal transduction histidine kinase
MARFYAISTIRYVFALLLLMALTGYMSYLVYSQYHAQEDLQRVSLNRLIDEHDKRAVSLRYFINDRLSDILDLSDNRELASYYENRALGMSIEYGLGASLIAAEESFRKFMDRQKLDTGSLYSRIVYIDASGSKLLDIHEKGLFAGEKRHWQDYVQPKKKNSAFLTESVNSAGYILISHPYNFKNLYSGQLLAWVSVEDIYSYLRGAATKDTHSVTALIFDKKYIRISDNAEHVIARSLLPEPGIMKANVPYTFRITNADSVTSSFIGLLTPVANTPIALAAFIPEKVGSGFGSPQRLLIIMSVIGVLIVGGGIVFVRTSMKNAILLTREEETSRLNAVLEQRVGERTSALETSHSKLEKAYTELKSAQAQILHQEKMASIGQLAAGVAHEINNPTGYILSNLHSLKIYTHRLLEYINLQTETLEKTAAFSADEMKQAAAELTAQRETLKIDHITRDIEPLIDETADGGLRVKHIVQSLKSFSHMDEAKSKAADINAALDNTLDVIWHEIKYKATINKDYGELPLTICNIGQLNQVFMNILINASHAIEKSGEIIIKTRLNGSNIVVSISDTGNGIPPEKINRIFDPFFTTKEVGKGTGLGLSIAYDIMKNHNGRIDVVSEIGTGTTFSIVIPLVE